MSFVNLLGNDVWLEADIVNRTENMIAGEFTPDQVTILNRIATAAALGEYTLTDDEKAQIAHYNQVCLDARAAGDAARVDNARLVQALAYEAAQVQATQAQAVIGAASSDTLALVAERAAAR